MKARSTQDRLFVFVCYLFITIFAVCCLFPFIYVLAYSVTPYDLYLLHPERFIPLRLDLSAYKQLFGFNLMYSGYRVTLIITIVGSLLNILLMLISAYPLSKSKLKGRNFILSMVLFTMFFNGGLIPNFYLVRSLHLLNNIWSLILPGLLSAYNLILMKNFISAIPDSLEESAIIDGANEIVVLFKIIVPLSMPAIATFVIFYAVGQWNTYFNAILYTSKRSLWPLMLILRELVVEDGAAMVDQSGQGQQYMTPFTMKMAAIIFSTVPILVIYPFFQRFFMEGILAGSVKG